MSEYLVPYGHAIERFACSAPRADELCDPAFQEQHHTFELTAELRDLVAGLERERFQALMKLLPEVEREILRLQLQGTTQAAIGAAMGVSQFAISYRRRRGIERLRFMQELDYPSFAPTLESDLREAGLGDLEAGALVALYREGSRAAAARALGIHREVATNRIRRGLEALRGAPEAARLVALFEALLGRPGLLCGVETQPGRSPKLRPCTAPDDGPRCVETPYELRNVSAEDIAHMRELMREGWSTERLAERFRLDPAYLNYLLFGDWFGACAE